jgi:hypothetical protein
MSAALHAHTDDDPSRTDTPPFHDARVVTEKEAVATVSALLAWRAHSAFGQNRRQWNEWLNDTLANVQSDAHLLIISPTAISGVRGMLHKAITVHANHLLAEMESDE